MEALQHRRIQLAALTATLVVIALAGLGWAGLNLGMPAPHQAVFILTGASLVVAGAVFSAPLPARIPMRLTLIPAACLICASALPAPWVILCVSVGALIAKVVTRFPHSLTLHKAVHNISKDIVAAMLATAIISCYGIKPVFGEMAVESAPSTSRFLLAVFHAALAIWLLEEVVTTAAVSLSMGRTFGAMARYMWQMRIMVGVTEAAVSAAVAALVNLDKRALIVLPVAMVLLHSSLSLRLKLREERQAWEKLRTLVDALTTRNLDEILRTATRGAVDLFGARAAELEIKASRRLIRANGDAVVVYDGPPRGAPRADRASTPAFVQEIAAERAGMHGVLRIYLEGTRDGLSARERSTLRALASAISTRIDIAVAYQRLSEESAGHQLAATQDLVTGLPNRTAFVRHIVHAEDVETCHVIVIGLEKFRFITEAVGRGRVDKIMEQLAQRLRDSFPERQSAVGRIGDDEFAAAVWASSETTAYQRACWAVSNLTREVEDSGRFVGLRVSAGLAAGPPAEAADLVLRAERRMRRAVRQGGDCRVVTTDPADHVTLGAQLRHSRVSMSFRPIVDLATGAIVLAQALPRWLYSPYEVLSADKYVYQLIDDQDDLDALTHTTLARAVAAAQTWRPQLSRAGMVVPVPGRSVNPTLVHGVQRLLRDHDAPPDTLILAVGASEGIQDLDAYRTLRRSGVRFMLQEFGSGERGLERLSAAQFDFLAVDVAYAMDSGWTHARSVIRAAVDLGMDLDLSVVVPGVVDEQHRRELLRLGCTLGAGPLFGDETFPSEFREHIARWQPQFERVAADTGEARAQRHRARRRARRGGDRPS
ncbi:EAL domain-containing protein [Micromonospora sp. NPDC051141]|uniref:EAL domain-containing protein n=1 Tax=Micromonospora sp. NPDC051141 TaxID=3364284 RepID=UPI0037A2A197